MLAVETLHATVEPASRCAIATDSQVVLGAVVKGRSSSVSMNDMLKSHLPTVLAYNIYPGHQYVPSADNPADDPTRDKDLRSPVHATPDWLVSAFAGDYRALDSFLEENGCDAAVLARLPRHDGGDLEPKFLESSRALRRKNFQQQMFLPPAKRTVTGQHEPAQTRLWSASAWGSLTPGARRALAGFSESRPSFSKELVHVSTEDCFEWQGSAGPFFRVTRSCPSSGETLEHLGFDL